MMLLPRPNRGILHEEVEPPMSNRRIVALFAPILALGLLAGCSSAAPAAAPEETQAPEDAPLYDQLPDAIKKAGVIKIAGDTHPPYRTIEESGEITGIDADLQAALTEQLGVPFEIV